MNFFYSFPIARTRSSSANGNGDRTLEVISIKIFGRGSDEKRRRPATDRRGGGEGKEGNCFILARTGNNVIIIYGTQTAQQTIERRRREAETSKWRKLRERKRDGDGDDKSGGADSSGEAARRTKCDDAVRKADKSADLVGISYRSIL